MKLFASHEAAVLLKRKTLLSLMKNYSIDLKVYKIKDDIENRFFYVVMDDNEYFVKNAWYIDMRHEKIFSQDVNAVLDDIKKKKLEENVVNIKNNYYE